MQIGFADGVDVMSEKKRKVVLNSPSALFFPSVIDLHQQMNTNSLILT